MVDNLVLAYGILSTILISLSLFISFKMISIYFKLKKKEFLFMSIVAIAIYEPWWAYAINLILALFFNSELLAGHRYFITYIGVPIGMYLWLVVFTEFLYINKKKLILTLIAIYGVLFETILLTMLYIDYELIRTYIFFYSLYFFSILLIILISGLLFARASLRSSNKEIKLKGKFLFIAFISFSIGALFENLLYSTILTIFFSIFFLIISVISFYFGFILPSWMKKHLSEEIIEK